MIIIVTWSLIATCVWLKLEPAFSMLVSSAKVCSSPAPNASQNVFVASDKHVHMQCDIPYLELSSREYLIASDERVCLQCDIVFWGAWSRPSQTSAGTSLRKLSLLNDICQNLGRSGPSNIRLNWYGLNTFKNYNTVGNIFCLVYLMYGKNW